MLLGASTFDVMDDLHVNSDRSDPVSAAEPRRAAPPSDPAREAPLLARGTRAVRSLAFLSVYFLYLMLAVGVGQRLLVWPLVTLLPGRRRAIVRAWLRLHAHGTLGLARSLADVRLTVDGRIPAESCVVLMNHQSVLDIPIGISLVPGPYPVIPTRARYRHGLPGVSPLTRLARYPFVTQGRKTSREELRALADVAEQVARGEQSLLIFPEGHRTRDGAIGPFMRTGLKLMLPRARRPVYCIVADGMWHARTFADAAFRFAGTRVRATILGPFDIPDDSASLDAFIDTLHRRMDAALASLRDGPAAREAAGDAAGARVRAS
jgi:1-acyl-sn-glycerol-3-phosphate acyltransferase